MSVVGKREGDVTQKRKAKKKTHLNEDAMGTRASWASVGAHKMVILCANISSKCMK
jgi:hypothetical protein